MQIIVSEIEQDEAGQVKGFARSSFGLDDTRYYYPASTVKLPIAILAHEWLAEQEVPGLNRETPMLNLTAREAQTEARFDSTSANLLPSIAHYAKKILLVSDNDAYNRLYELLGQDYINEKLRQKGLAHTVINHRLSIPLPAEENRHVNPIRFLQADGSTLFELPAREASGVYVNQDAPMLAKQYYIGDSLVSAPMDFTTKNKYALGDFMATLERLVFPEAFSSEQQFAVAAEDRDFLLTYMGMLPHESQFPAYDPKEFYPSYSKFFKFGTSKEPIPDQFRLYNKTGMAYGHLLDGGYFVDEEKGISYFIAAVIYVNENETLNDNSYEYDEVGFPFFAELGEYVYQHFVRRQETGTFTPYQRLGTSPWEQALKKK
ncbi:hypothetical protein A3SI_07604 [Nitritalea halalkaliphila LW7]|uniref:Beta-lactamase class A catalytic domain-containing protein n=1 Tax=Nitritalea halalkaliphila LW7 TaxID=1189621 RepID=I5C5P0_9BACT|nr:serine hydrolase [Nitritalea halalkaliphila]EIM77142.1 hypothetical protein A3SI_07604 [Nitritalea halalkaliphila LW7]